jgi:sugar/nucleoside kinase (ribokinase family)
MDDADREEQFDADLTDPLDADLEDRLDAETRPRAVTALPDGSVDSYYDAYGDRAERITSAADFGERVAESDNPSVRLSRTARTPGGQAVTMARQAHALGDDATLFGHLDDPVFDDLDFEARSMGEPEAVQVLEFDDEEVLLADNSADVTDWRLADLEAVADDPDAALTAEAVCCGNWVSVENLSEELQRLAGRSLDGDLFLLDPGNVAAADPGRVRDLADALRELGDTHEVVVSANRPELRAAVEILDARADAPDASDRPARVTDDSEIVAAVRERTGATAVVMHETDAAIAATPEGRKRVPNYEVRDANRPTGAGDCFTAALAHALVRDWHWTEALDLANLAAVHRVETGEPGDRASLREFLQSHERKE